MESFPLKIISYYDYGFNYGFNWFNMASTLEDILVMEEKVADDVFPDPPPAAPAPDPRARRLAMRVLNRKPPEDIIIPMAALSILAVDTGVPSPSATPLLSHTLLLPPMMCDDTEGFLSVSATKGSAQRHRGSWYNIPRPWRYQQTHLGPSAQCLWRIRWTQKGIRPHQR